LSQDPTLIQLFNEGRDFHAETAQIFRLASRDEAKPINFGIIFGQGPRALAREVNKSWKEEGLDREIDEAQAEDMIQTFFDQYAEIGPYFETVYRELTSDRKLEKVLRNSLTGRVRKFHFRNSAKLKRVMKATLLQQIESHLLKLALIRLHSELKALGTGARIVMVIHDAIWIEAPQGEAERVRHLMRRIMTRAGKLGVPLEVEITQKYSYLAF
jgi:DNA polymerase-1